MIFYITTHEKNIKYAKKVKYMFSKTSYEFYFVYGKNQSNKLNPYIEVDCKDSYEDLSLKTYFILNHFLQTQHTHLAKMDDDTFINFSKFFPDSITEDYAGMFLQHSNKQKSTIEHWFKINNEKFKVKKQLYDVRYAEGSFYILSKKAAQLCYDKGYDFYVNTPSTYIGEDVKVGLCLQGKDITLLDLMHKTNLHYEATEDLSIIHPVNILLFDKLMSTSSFNETKNLLIKYDFLNDNTKRDIYLTNLLNQVL